MNLPRRHLFVVRLVFSFRGFNHDEALTLARVQAWYGAKAHGHTVMIDSDFFALTYEQQEAAVFDMMS